MHSQSYSEIKPDVFYDLRRHPVADQGLGGLVLSAVFWGPRRGEAGGVSEVAGIQSQHNR